MRFMCRALRFAKVYPQQVIHNVAELLSDLYEDLTVNCADLKSGATAILTTQPSKQQLHDFAITVAAFTALPIILLIIPIVAIMASFDSAFDAIRDI